MSLFTGLLGLPLVPVRPMTMRAFRVVGKAAGERALGLGPGPIRAAVAATITGAATAALTYKALRSDKLGGGSGD